MGFEAPNTLHSVSTMRLVDVLCEGQIEGLANGNRSVFIDGTSVQAADGTQNIQGAHVDLRTGTQNQSAVRAARHGGTQTDTRFNIEVRHGAPVIRTISNTDTDRARVTLRFPNLTHRLNDGRIVGIVISYTIQSRPSSGGTWRGSTYGLNDKTEVAPISWAVYKES